MVSKSFSRIFDVKLFPSTNRPMNLLSGTSGLSGSIGAHSTVEFISDVRGHRTSWPFLIFAGLLVVCLVGYSASHFLFTPSRPSSSLEGRMEFDANGNGSRYTGPALENMNEARELQTIGRIPKNAGAPRKALAFFMQSEAEGALQSDYSSLKGDVLKPEKGDNGTVYEQVQKLLSAADEAVSGENLESFLSLLDENEESFVRRQKIRTRLAFRQFNEIEGTYSDVKVRPLNDDKLAIDLHCKVKAATARSGRPIVLFDGDQTITLRKVADATWKICAID